MKKGLRVILFFFPFLLSLNIRSQVCFSPATFWPTNPASHDITTADFNGDGKQDIVTANHERSITVLINNGSGGFMPANNYSVSGHTRGAACNDYNGDGNIDIAAVANGIDSD